MDSVIEKASQWAVLADYKRVIVRPFGPNGEIGIEFTYQNMNNYSTEEYMNNTLNELSHQFPGTAISCNIAAQPFLLKASA